MGGGGQQTVDTSTEGGSSEGVEEEGGERSTQVVLITIEEGVGGKRTAGWRVCKKCTDEWLKGVVSRW